MRSTVKDYLGKERDRLDREDGRGRGEETIRLTSTLPEVNRTVDVQLAAGTIVSMRTRMDLILAQYMLLRGEDRRHAELPDMFSIEAIKESVKGCGVKMLVLRLGRGKVLFLSVCSRLALLFLRWHFSFYLSINLANFRQIKMA